MRKITVAALIATVLVPVATAPTAARAYADKRVRDRAGEGPGCRPRGLLGVAGWSADAAVPRKPAPEVVSGVFVSRTPDSSGPVRNPADDFALSVLPAPRWPGPPAAQMMALGEPWVVPLLFGSGIRVEAGRAALEPVRTEPSPRVTHPTYAVRRSSRARPGVGEGEWPGRSRSRASGHDLNSPTCSSRSGSGAPVAWASTRPTLSEGMPPRG